MLASLLGVRLVLMVGRTIPTPAPLAVTSALTKVEVHNNSDGPDGFQLTFSLSRDTPIDYSLLQGGLLDPPSRVVIGVVLGVVPEVLIDGIITHHQLDPEGGEGSATLTVTGTDVRVMMDMEERDESFPNQPDFLIVTRLIAGYANLGLIPAVAPTTDVPIVLQRTPWQRETDLECIERLARDNGYVFYIEPVTFFVNKAYWGPENRAGLPQSTLSVNMGDWSNVTALNFSNDALAPVGTRGTFVEPITRTAIPIPALPSLKIPPLASRPAQPLRTRRLREASNQSPGRAASTAVAAVTGAPDAVTASGELETVRYGAVLRARRLVGVRGSGLNYNGFYYVRSVTHTIERGSYRQRFSLSREGTGSITPVVRP